MVRSPDGEFIYLIVPEEYECVYSKILVMMTNVGIDLVKNCSCSNRDTNLIIDCWNIFQAACSAYTLGEINKANYMLSYIKSKLNINCGGNIPIEEPSINNFSLNINDVSGDATLIINLATFDLTNIEFIAVDSLKIINVDSEEIIAENLSIESPSVIPDYNLNVVVGNSYSFRASIKDINGVEYFSNIYTITAYSFNVMYYGNTNISPMTFQNMPIEDIFDLQGITSKNINGVNNNEFIIHQTENIHYLLIPEDLMDLIKAEYGTSLITTLWNNDTQSGAYFTTNPGGEYGGINYKVFFSFSPIGGFPDDIRITCKNK